MAPTLNILAFLDGLGGPEMLLIFLLVLMLFGGKKMPEVARGFGKAMREFKRAASGVEDEFRKAMDVDSPPQRPSVPPRRHSPPPKAAPITDPSATPNPQPATSPKPQPKTATPPPAAESSSAPAADSADDQALRDDQDSAKPTN